MPAQQISAITLGVAGLPASRRFYTQGFGWAAIFENDEIIFYQMNGLVLGTWLKAALEADAMLPAPPAGAMTLAHNVPAREDVAVLMARLEQQGGRVLRGADAPAHGGYRGYIADPDGHVWEIAYNPAWSIDAEGHVTFGL